MSTAAATGDRPQPGRANVGLHNVVTVVHLRCVTSPFTTFYKFPGAYDTDHELCRRDRSH